MTPNATTPAGGRMTKRPNDPSPPSGPGHRRTLRQKPAPRAARRVSGPLGGRAGTAAATASAGVTAGAASLGRSAGAAIPVPGIARPQRRTRSARRPLSLPARSLEFVRGLPDHRLLDRAVRGRAWILMLGVMLAGIVAMQVEVLKLGASMGRAIETGTALQSRNDLLRAYVAYLEDDQRIERLAAAMGMVMPAPSGVGFLSAGSVEVRRAATNIHAPDPNTFLAALAASEAPTSTQSSPASTALTASSSAAPTTPIAAAAPTQAPTTTDSSVAAAPPASSSTVTAQPTAPPQTTALTPTAAPVQTAAPVASAPPAGQSASSSGGTSATGG